MAWRQGPQDFNTLNTLSNLTVRLLRLVVFDKLKRGETQLQAYGVPAGLTEAYKEHVKSQPHNLIPKKGEDLEDNFIHVSKTGRSTF